jgi:hypothetical protein
MELEIGLSFAQQTIAQRNTQIGMAVLKSEFESQQALANILMEQSGQINAITYNGRGQMVQNPGPSIDARI